MFDSSDQTEDIDMGYRMSDWMEEHAVEFLGLVIVTMVLALPFTLFVLMGDAR